MAEGERGVGQVRVLAGGVLHHQDLRVNSIFSCTLS